MSKTTSYKRSKDESADEGAEMLSLNLISVLIASVKMELWLSLGVGTTITVWWLHASVRHTITGQRKSSVGVRTTTCGVFLEDRLVESETVVWSPKLFHPATLERQFVISLHFQLIPPATAYCLSRAVLHLNGWGMQWKPFILFTASLVLFLSDRLYSHHKETGSGFMSVNSFRTRPKQSGNKFWFV